MVGRDAVVQGDSMALKIGYLAPECWVGGVLTAFAVATNIIDQLSATRLKMVQNIAIAMPRKPFTAMTS